MKQSGSGLIVALIVFGLILLLGSFLLKITMTGLDISNSFLDGIKAQYIAEAGIKYVTTKLREDPNFINATQFNTDFQSEVTGLSGGDCRVYIRSDGDQRTILSVGQVHHAKRTIKVILKIPMVNRDTKMIYFKN
ncbi:hypothetical protein [Anaerosinus massiliensis]|uniref:hypothetical protein n=1 Tax=Massilibacillus massiliensis TaxID=1806837 RepID=UPI000DA62252|nr:hypothetical protein [Massilibacillus massiliensis]